MCEVNDSKKIQNGPIPAADREDLTALYQFLGVLQKISHVLSLIDQAEIAKI